MAEPTIQDLFNLDGKVAVVTGGAGYLGSAMASALAEAGARVVVASRDLEKCRRKAESLGPGHLAMKLDVADEQGVRDFIDQVIGDAGRIDVLVNNAYSGSHPDIDDATGADFAEAYNTGLIAYFVAAQQAYRHMRRQGEGGSIINIASMYGVVASYPEAYVGLPVNSPPNYHALKGAVVHLTRHLAAYWAEHGIRVNVVSPGPFPHTKTRQDMPEFIGRLEKKVPLGRMGEPHELKGVVALLASEAGSYITGQNILVDGGWTAW